MNATTIEQDLRQALTEACQTELAPIGLEDDLVYELELDSMASLRLLAVVEKRFDIRFPDHLLGEYRTLQKLVDFISNTQEEAS